MTFAALRLHAKNTTLDTPAKIIDFVKRSPAAFQLDQAGKVIRLLALALTGVLMFWLIEGFAYIWGTPQSIVAAVADAATLPEDVVPAMNVVAMALLMPQLYVLLFRPEYQAARWPRVLAMIAAALAFLGWFYLCFVAIDFPVSQVGFAPLLYLFRAAGSALVAITFGYMVNSQQLQDWHEWAAREQRLRQQQAWAEGARAVG